MSARYKFAVLFSLVLAMTPALAQDIMVRSGEHDGFSRIVVDMPKRVPWTMSEDGNRLEIRFEDVSGKIKVDKVFDRLSNNRIVAVDPLPDGLGLALEMSCDCIADVAWHGLGMFVIDILADPERVEEHSGQDLGALKVLNFDEGPELASPSRLPHTSDQLWRDWFYSLDFPKSAGATQSMEEIRASIAQDLSEAATMGLLNLDGNLDNAEESASSISSTSSSSEPNVDSSSPFAHNQVNYGVKSAAELNSKNSASETDHTINGTQCIDDKLISLKDWGDNSSFAHQIGNARIRSMGEFDRFLPEEMLHLARLYLHFGFGKEAMQVIDVSGLKGPAADAVLSLARVIEQEAGGGDAFAHQIDCDAQVSLWSALVSAEQAFEQSPNVNAMLRTLTGYPSHLRSLIGPRLARAFSARGRQDDSTRILRVLSQRSDDATDAYEMAHAETLRDAEHSESVAEAYENIVSKNSEHSVEALVDMIWARLDAEEPLEPRIIDLIESYIRENRDADIGDDLLDAQIAALAELGQFEKAFDLLKGRSGSVANGSDRMERVLTANLVKDASDMVFLKYALIEETTKMPRAPLSASLEMAQRLFRLGFREEAQLYLDRSKDKTLAAHRLLQASLHIASSNPDAALRSLVEVGGSEADTLRAQAHSLAGDHRAAHLAYIAAGNTKDGLREALLAEAWKDARNIADPIMADVIFEEDQTVQRAEDGQLQGAVRLLEQSNNARDKISQLLSGSLPVDAAASR
ncbi:hypothetical protein ACEWPM_010000 [Roseovarius sp. S4756]|uniref:hypothetical protein n=1 Tax=Roseovarius maritimus TaxID=3342637 RepID=UPI00372B7DAE